MYRDTDRKFIANTCPPMARKLLSVLLAGVMTSHGIVALAQENEPPSLRFEDITGQLNPSFKITGESFMPGVAFIDYNNNSLTDIYVANGMGKPNALYRNNGDGTYTDVAEQAGLADTGYTTGIAVGDLNNNGYDDLYVAAQTTMGDGLDIPDGPDSIYINNGDGTFTNITDVVGFSEAGFTTSVAFLDYDGDGYLDILVGRMIDMDIFDAEANRTNPTTRSRLYRNQGDLTFVDVTEQAGIGTDYATWAVAAFDFNNNGHVDIFLAHEQGPISVFRNNGDGTFTNITQIAGDVKEYGAWMGLAIGDYNNDGYQDIYASNISDLEITRDPSRPSIGVPPRETWDNPWPTLFRNNGDGTFTDVGEEAGVKIPMEFSWGTMFADFNNNGWPDIYLAQNFAPVGVIGDAPNGAGPGRLFMNLGDGTFKEVAESAGVANEGADGLWLDARGSATADFDKDGRMDFFLVNTPQYEMEPPFNIIPDTGRPYLFRNVTENDNNWLQLRLIGQGGSNRNAIGARAELISEAFEEQGIRRVGALYGGGSVYSYSERIVHFGLGEERKVGLKVTWPDGDEQTFRKVPINDRLTIVQGCTRVFREKVMEAYARNDLSPEQMCDRRGR